MLSDSTALRSPPGRALQPALDCVEILYRETQVPAGCETGLDVAAIYRADRVDYLIPSHRAASLVKARLHMCFNRSKRFKQAKPASGPQFGRRPGDESSSSGCWARVTARLKSMSPALISSFRLRSIVFIFSFAPVSSFVVAKRIKYGEPIYGADRTSLHHRFLNIGYSQKRAALTMWAWCAVLAARRSPRGSSTRTPTASGTHGRPSRSRRWRRRARSLDLHGVPARDREAGEPAHSPPRAGSA